MNGIAVDANAKKDFQNVHIYSFPISTLLRTGCVGTLKRHEEYSLNTHTIFNTYQQNGHCLKRAAPYKQYAESQHREKKRRGQARGGRACRSFKRQG